MENNQVPEGMPVVGLSANTKPEIPAKAPDQEGTAPLKPQPSPAQKKEEIFSPIYDPQVPAEIEPNSFYSQAVDEITTKQTITDDTLRKDPKFLDAARVLAQVDYPDEWQDMDDDDLGTYLLTKANRLNYNMTKAIAASIEYEDAPDEEKAALAYALQQYEDKEWSGAGAAGMMWSMISDPINIGAMFATGGVAAGAKLVGGKSITGKILQKLMLNPKTMLAAEGATWGAGGMYADEDMRATVDKNKEGVDPLAVGMGAAFGAALPGAVGVAGKTIAKGYQGAMKWAEGGLAEAAGGGNYRMSHQSPSKEGANVGYDVSDVYPDDIYSSKGRYYYGMGDEFKKADEETLKTMRKMKGSPEEDIIIYRSVPKGVLDKGEGINEGDWVSLSKTYVKQHGDAWLDGNYEVLEKRVKAKDIFTAGDGLAEWGYHPEGD